MSRLEFTKKTMREAYERSEGTDMSRLMSCAYCGTDFTRKYAISAARAKRQQYCGRQCVALASALKGDARSAQSFNSRIDKSGGLDQCWPWTGRLDPNGYGRFDRGSKPQLAHRIAYFLANPEANQSLAVCHSCDNPPCCNPAHLWLGTQPENIADMDRKGRRKTVVRRGEASNKAKLTSDQALTIFNSRESDTVLGAKFGVTPTAIRLIKNGTNWSHVTGGRDAS